MTDNQTDEPGSGPGRVRPFADVLRDVGRGAVIDEAAHQLQTLVREVRESGKKGTLTLKVEVAPMKGNADVVALAVRADLKLPAGEPLAAVMFYDDDGNLLRDDPKQLQLSLREVPRETKELKNA